MNRKTCTLGFTLAFLSILLSCSSKDSGKASEEDLVPNPLYVHWAKFKPGSYSVLKQETRIVRAQAQTFSRVTLSEVSEAGVIVEIHHILEHVNPDQTDGPPERRFIPALISKIAAERQETPPGKTRKGYETLNHGTVTLETRWVETNLEQGPLSKLAKVWYCEEVPNRVVKESVTMKGMTVEKSLVEYKVAE